MIVFLDFSTQSSPPREGGPSSGERLAGGLNSSYIVVRGGIQGEPRALFTAGAPFRVYQGRVLIRRATV